MTVCLDSFCILIVHNNDDDDNNDGEKGTNYLPNQNIYINEVKSE